MTVNKKLGTGFEHIYAQPEAGEAEKVAEAVSAYASLDKLEKSIRSLEGEMNRAARDLEFEKAAKLRDRINELKKMVVFDFEASP
jgi:excinuclease UvrABC helicase subunit UvrB